ncbi:MAG: PEP-CTERM system histidine kinase PrsK, partial [Proteobacteria bacterium]|nr:PEP-CTERM system histidine kinase PrsK [Pseudomonadota bacterium]
MGSGIAIITAWSYGLAGVVYGAFALYLASGRNGGERRRALFVAALSCELWAAAGLAFALSGEALYLAASLLTDVLRFGGWYFFLLVLLRVGHGDAAADGAVTTARWPRMTAAAVALVGLGVAVQLAILLEPALGASLQRLALLDSLAMAVFGLVLVEQLFRTAASDSRWSIKPLCLGLAGAFLYDLYLYSEALLFNQLDLDAFSIRGFVHALVVPLVAVSTIRSRDWKTRLVLSQRAAMQSATLLMVGVYLLFMAAAGYYVRYFGGDWGRAFQLALLFAALLALGVLAVSGSMRAKLRVLIGKHFFSYR